MGIQMSSAFANALASQLASAGTVTSNLAAYGGQQLSPGQMIQSPYPSIHYPSYATDYATSYTLTHNGNPGWDYATTEIKKVKKAVLSFAEELREEINEWLK